MNNYNPLLPEGKYRSIHAKDWMFDFCKHHGINSKVLPFLINYILYYVSKNYDILEAADNAPTVPKNQFDFSTTVSALCDAMMGLASRPRMQDTFLPDLEKTGFIKLKSTSGSGRVYRVDFDILNAFLEDRGCYKKNNPSLYSKRKERRERANSQK